MAERRKSVSATGARGGSAAATGKKMQLNWSGPLPAGQKTLMRSPFLSQPFVRPKRVEEVRVRAEC